MLLLVAGLVVVVRSLATASVILAMLLVMIGHVWAIAVVLAAVVVPAVVGPVAVAVAAAVVASAVVLVVIIVVVVPVAWRLVLVSLLVVIVVGGSVAVVGTMVLLVVPWAALLVATAALVVLLILLVVALIVLVVGWRLLLGVWSWVHVLLWLIGLGNLGLGLALLKTVHVLIGGLVILVGFGILLWGRHREGKLRTWRQGGQPGDRRLEEAKSRRHRKPSKLPTDVQIWRQWRLLCLLLVPQDLIQRFSDVAVCHVVQTLITAKSIH